MTTDTPVLLRTLEQIELDDVDDNPWQPRSGLDPERTQELADSIREVGLLQPPMVRQVAADGLLGKAGAIRYQTAFGHYRIAALKLLGVAMAELEVRNLTDADMAIIALTENRKRTDVAPIEQYRAWQKALEIDGMTIARLAETMGFDRSTVSNNLRLLKLPDYILEHVDSGELSAHAAREFLCLMGLDGHFHDDIAKSVINSLTTGTPDWRAVRVRFLIMMDIERRPVAEWRKLYKTDPNKQTYETGTPSFDIDGFKAMYTEHVHAVPWDEYDGHTYSGPTNAKVKQERSRDWTCATKEWSRAQAAGKKAAAAVVAATPSSDGLAKPSSDFTRTLANDPVYKTVSPETAGPLLKTKGKELDIEAATALGTRAVPAELKKNGFKAYVGEGNVWHDYGSNVSEVPSYFDNIAECRKTCTIGATYARFGKGELRLYCLNKEHFEEKKAKGLEAAQKRLEKKAKERDEKDGHVYDLIAGGWKLPDAVARLLAISLHEGIRFEPVYPGNANNYREIDDVGLKFWRANTTRVFTLLGKEKPDYWLRGAEKLINALSAADVHELLARLLVERLADETLEKVREAFAATAEGAQ